MLETDQIEAAAGRLYRQLKRERIEPCTVCKGTGIVAVTTDWLDDIVPITKTEHCECKRRVLFDLALHEVGLPRELWRADEIVPEFNCEHFALLHALADNFGEAITGGLSVMMVGENGTGKSSSAAVAVIGALRRGDSAAFVSWPDLVNVARQARFNALRYRKILARLRRTLVVLDEVGKESPINAADEFPQQLLDSVLRQRRGDRRPTILITNYSVAKFVRRYGESVRSLISPPYRLLEFEPGDFRSRVDNPWANFGGDS